LSFKYLAFNTNTIETLVSTGNIKLIPVTIRIKLIELKSLQEITSKVATGNDAVYLSAQQKAFQLGLQRFRNPEGYQSKINEKLNINNNVSKIILTLEAALGLKNYSERYRIETLKKMLEMSKR
jgi:hypothetical protein